jgi:sec-independent protein translocase protein TatB
MMPGIGFTEMILLVVVAIVVIGPKDLPLMMRKFGKFTGKMRAMAYEFQQGLDELGRQAELEELRKEVADLKRHTGLDELHKDLAETSNEIAQDYSSQMYDSGARDLTSDASPVDSSEMPALPAPAADAVAATLPDHQPDVHVLGEPDALPNPLNGLTPADGEPVAVPAQASSSPAAKVDASAI